MANGRSRARGPRPQVVPRQPIDDYAEYELLGLLQWVQSDGRLRTDAELVDELVQALGYHRRGPRILDRLQRVVEGARRRPR
jgi:hypothetical protein